MVAQKNPEAFFLSNQQTEFPETVLPSSSPEKGKEVFKKKTKNALLRGHWANPWDGLILGISPECDQEQASLEAGNHPCGSLRVKPHQSWE